MTLKTRAAILILGLVLIFGRFGGESSGLVTKTIARETFRAMALCIENDLERDPEKRNINSIAALQEFQKRAQRFAIGKGDFTDDELEQWSNEFKKLDDIPESDKYDTWAKAWIDKARKVSESI
jgi:hypothetical protein